MYDITKIPPRKYVLVSSDSENQAYYHEPSQIWMSDINRATIFDYLGEEHNVNEIEVPNILHGDFSAPRMLFVTVQLTPEQYE